MGWVTAGSTRVCTVLVCSQRSGLTHPVHLCPSGKMKASKDRKWTDAACDNTSPVYMVSLCKLVSGLWVTEMEIITALVDSCGSGKTVLNFTVILDQQFNLLLITCSCYRLWWHMYGICLWCVQSWMMELRRQLMVVQITYASPALCCCLLTPKLLTAVYISAMLLIMLALIRHQLISQSSVRTPHLDAVV